MGASDRLAHHAVRPVGRLARARADRGRLTAQRGFALAAGVLVAGFAGWAVLSTSVTAARVGQGALGALWLLPGLMALHFLQLLLSAQAWRMLLVIPGCHSLGDTPPLGRAALWRLRVAREGIDSLLPVAQVGGEVIAARILARRGIAMARAAASVVVDVTLEFVSQLGFLAIGLVALAAVSPAAAWRGWLVIGLLTAAGAMGLLGAQLAGGLRLMERLAGAIAARWPAAGAGTLVGLHGAAAVLYARTGPLLGAGGLHLLAWLAGSIESWAVLHALDVPVSPLAALAVESLGMAARSAGFAIPGALVIQETGFVLAAVAVGMPEAAGLSLSLVKRAREVLVGLVGLVLWWWLAVAGVPREG